MKTILTREFYKPKNMEKVISMTGTELYMTTDTTMHYPYKAMGFSGKKAIYDFYLCFQTIEKRAEYVNKWEANIRARNEAKQKRKDERKSPTTLKEGDIMYSSWGYDQTNIDWYQVTKVISPRMIEIREIYGQRDTTDMPYDQGKTTPKKDFFIPESKPMRKIVNASNTVHIESYASAWAWDGRPKNYSTYA